MYPLSSLIVSQSGKVDEDANTPSTLIITWYRLRFTCQRNVTDKREMNLHVSQKIFSRILSLPVLWMGIVQARFGLLSFLYFR